MSRQISFRVVMTKRTRDLPKANYFDFQKCLKKPKYRQRKMESFVTTRI